MRTTIRIQIVPSRSGCWSVWANGMRIIRSTREPLVEIAARLIAAGHKPQRQITMTRSLAGPCRYSSTLAEAAAADAGGPFRAPAWKPMPMASPPNGGHLQ